MPSFSSINMAYNRLTPCSLSCSMIITNVLFVPDKWWKHGKGPIFFYTGNEGDITEFLNATGFMFDIAPQFEALIVFAEHVSTLNLYLSLYV